MTTELLVIAFVVFCFLIGALNDRYNLGSPQEVLRLFQQFTSNSHRQAFDYMTQQRNQRQRTER